MSRLLILGGTTEATRLAAALQDWPQLEVQTSLAGRTQQPVLPAGSVRIGGFGGVAGLVDYLQAESIDLLIDATHPFAAQISQNAAEAAQQVGIPSLILQRPAWVPQAGDRWISVPDLAMAAEQLANLGDRIFLTIGRQELAAFADLRDRWFLMRMIDPPAEAAPLPPGEILLERGPFSLEHERSLLMQYQINAIVSKNSGGSATTSKLQAARELSLPVVMVERPVLPNIQQATTLDAAFQWLKIHC
ncbi:cobalt-precorrin-6A reductase [Synechococcus elongatus]|uniref:Cobalt-precorrin-6A reductase n=1 Tax=Synechococcus elongatus PCC 11801 TaxID=2219813 RepID=A0AAN1QMC0_SYNEL|nr:cobalt-precorrin-6A reductase [Synechococcus elongatus]AZB71820.1 cobalt-precorrin-6A reductase [Synechococcus elongatus PCC 11801]